MLRRLAFVVCLPLAGWSQRVDIGLKGGVPLTNSFQTASQFFIDFGESDASTTRRYAVGPMLSISLTRRLGLEADILYQRLGYDSVSKQLQVEYFYTRAIEGCWEFPVLGTFQFLKRLPGNPYVSGGPEFRATTVRSVFTSAAYNGMPFASRPLSAATLSTHGVAIGVGGAVRVGKLRIAPEFRYTRWAGDPNIDPDLYSNQNQVELLVGLSLAVR